MLSRSAEIFIIYKLWERECTQKRNDTNTIHIFAQHKCVDCGVEVCSSCSNFSFVSFVLGWRKPRRLCIDCIGKVKIQINDKVREKPELKIQADKELRDIFLVSFVFLFLIIFWFFYGFILNVFICSLRCHIIVKSSIFYFIIINLLLLLPSFTILIS